MLKALQNSLSSILFPQECGCCGSETESVDYGPACGRCWSETTIFSGAEMLCDRCGAVLGPQAAPMPVFCRKCDHYSFDKAFALGVYEKALSASILELKKTPHLARRLRKLVRAFTASRLQETEFDLIIPVPLSPSRKAERGFNQAELIAREFRAGLDARVDSGSLARKVHTPIHRAGMDQKARELSVAKTFEVTRPSLVKGKRILLVDDVLTSGATSSACAAVLKKNGAAEVKVFTLARAVLR